MSGTAAALRGAPPGRAQVITASGAGVLDILPLLAAGYTSCFVDRQNSGSAGGSGRRGAAASVRCAGGPGASGAFNAHRITLAELLVLYPTGQVPYTVGAAPAGGAAVAVDDTNGNAGANSNPTNFGPFATSVLLALGGSGGTNATGAAGVVGYGQVPGAVGSAASTTGGAGVTSGLGAQSTRPGLSASGGGITAGDVPGNGGAGRPASDTTTTAGTAGVVGGAAPSSGVASPLAGAPGPGVGGGAASILGAAQAGADGLPNSGAGGGGGGASLNGNLSGAGGAGGSGYLRLAFA